MQKLLLEGFTLCADIETKKAQAYYMLSIIARVLNQGKEGYHEIGYYANCYTCDLYQSDSRWGRIRFATNEIAEHVIKHFKNILDVLYL